VGKAVMYEVRRDVDLGPRTLRRGQKIALDEIEKLAPGKAGPLRRTGLIRPVGGSDRGEMEWRRAQKHDRLAQSHSHEIAQLKAGGNR
jgi:hypothetical protein